MLPAVLLFLVQEHDNGEPSLSSEPPASADPSGSETAHESSQEPVGTARSCEEEMPLLQPSAASSTEKAKAALPPPEGMHPEGASPSPPNGTSISSQNSLHSEDGALPQLEQDDGANRNTSKEDLPSSTTD